MKQYLELAKSILPENSELLYLTYYGSKLYGTDNENSDVDIKGIFISSLDDLILKKDKKQVSYSSGNKNEKNSKDDIDITIYSLHYFLELLQKGETGALDLLFSMYRDDTVILKNNIDIIIRNKDNLISKNSQAFIGYALNQAAKYGIKGSRLGDVMRFREYLNKFQNNDRLEICDFDLEEFKYISFEIKNGLKYISILGKLYGLHFTVENLKNICDETINAFGSRTKDSVNGVDYKALSHALRVVDEMLELSRNKFITFPLENSEYIKKVKGANEPLEIVLEKIREGIDCVEVNLEKSDLPNKVEDKIIENIILEYYKN